MNTKLEELLNEIEAQEIEYIETKRLPRKLKGLYSDGTIYIDRSLSEPDKACIIAEELGHHYTSHGDIRDQSSLENQKQEMRARRWAHSKLIPLDELANVLKKNPANRFELSEELGVSEEFLDEAIGEYKAIYGTFVRLDGGLCIYFEPSFAVGYFFE